MKNTVTIQDVATRLNAELFGDGNAHVLDVTHDSRAAREGTLFAAIKGSTVDGHRFIEDVMRRGAVGVISEFEPEAEFSGAWLKVPHARAALAQAADLIHGEPSHNIDLIGITGTNGKTTTTYLCYALAAAANKKVAMLTTVEYRIGERSEEAVRTTPEASDTNRFLGEAIEAGCSIAVMEASSQAIDLHRCDALRFKIAAFTNLTRDHLDYHETMEEYFEAKKKLFDGRLGDAPEVSIVNIDDEWGRNLVADLRSRGQKVFTTAIDSDADLTAKDIDVSLVRGTSFLLKTPDGERRITSPLVGKPHVYNMLTATAAVLALGHDLDSVEKGLATCVGAPGRFERVSHDGDFAVVVDYAHTDDALLNTLQTAKSLTEAKLITVFGCGGDRDRTKREPMGRVAGSLSDLVVITSDNPRNEDPQRIIDEIEVGVKAESAEYLVVSDRREAIQKAISLAQAEDVVIIAGKGHENYQIIGTEKFHFDDREVASEFLELLAEER